MYLLYKTVFLYNCNCLKTDSNPHTLPSKRFISKRTTPPTPQQFQLGIPIPKQGNVVILSHSCGMCKNLLQLCNLYVPRTCTSSTAAILPWILSSFRGTQYKSLLQSQILLSLFVAAFWFSSHFSLWFSFFV